MLQTPSSFHTVHLLVTASINVQINLAILNQWHADLSNYNIMIQVENSNIKHDSGNLACHTDMIRYLQQCLSNTKNIFNETEWLQKVKGIRTDSMFFISFCLNSTGKHNCLVHTAPVDTNILSGGNEQDILAGL